MLATRGSSSFKASNSSLESCEEEPDCDSSSVEDELDDAAEDSLEEASDELSCSRPLARWEDAWAFPDDDAAAEDPLVRHKDADLDATLSLASCCDCKVMMWLIKDKQLQCCAWCCMMACNACPAPGLISRGRIVGAASPSKVRT